ncbi:MAG: fructose-1,6-bisphosphatase [Candidatus Gracilibacteria bacterium]|nr:fructose-1,6-bisphosphatase [Candidatus Gracilibacteria bacterium]
MKTFCDCLNENAVSEELFSVFTSLKNAVKEISRVVKTSGTEKAGTQNIYGEDQLALDVLADKIIMDELKKNPLVGLVASEELPDEVKLGDGEYAVCYDPLDGSSLVDVNLAVGTIFGVYKRKTFVGAKGNEQVAALIAVYGPRTTVVLTSGKRVQEFVLGSDNKFVLANDDIKIEEGKMFAPGNLRAVSERADYMNLVDYWCKEKYTLRYSGGMVPDINQILLKGKGIFSYPGYGDVPDGKLRLLFECAPMAFLVTQAGGAASDGNVEILEKVVEKLDQRTPIYIGSKGEVERCCKFLQ